MVIRKETAVVIVVMMALTGLSQGARANDECAIDASVGSNWLATGVITRVDGSVLYLLGKDNQVYEVSTAGTEFVLDGAGPGNYVPMVGDTVRVYGDVARGCKIDATRVRIYRPDAGQPLGAGPQKEIKIIIEKEAPTPPPAAVPVPPQPTPPREPANWEGRGLIMNVSYAGRTINIRNSTAQFTIRVARAEIVDAGRLIGLGLLNIGDTVRVVGNLVGLNEIDAHRVSVTRASYDAQNALPETPISVVGLIETIDYPSMTFKLKTEGPTLVVMADVDTVIQFQSLRKAFMDLKPGYRVKMSGYGNLAAGYAARHIQIIGVTP
jgi:hypothetical protein